MRVRDHLFLSTSGAVLLAPWLKRRVLLPWSASVFIDADHYLWFCAHERSVNLLRAVRFFNQAQPPQHAGTRLLHHPALLLLLALLGTRWRWMWLLVLGMGFHASLDAYHAVRLSDARRHTLQRDRETCQACGAQGADIVAHVWRQPRLLPSYRSDDMVSLCAQCHEAAHSGTLQVTERMPAIHARA